MKVFGCQIVTEMNVMSEICVNTKSKKRITVKHGYNEHAFDELTLKRK